MPDRNPRFARFWARLVPLLEGGRVTRQRARLLAGASGVVVEIGAGDGVGFAHYPPAVTRVLAVEPESRLRERAEHRAAAAPVPVEVVDGVAERLPLPDDSVDTVVSCLVLCSVPDQAEALAEVRRVLRPGGRLLFWEHVRSDRPALARLQRGVDRAFWPRLFGGCHTARDTVASIRAAGLAPAGVRPHALPAVPGVAGTAVAAGSDG